MSYFLTKYFIFVVGNHYRKDNKGDSLFVVRMDCLLIGIAGLKAFSTCRIFMTTVLIYNYLWKTAGPF